MSDPRPPSEASTRARLLPTNRMEAFSDGVFAIVITVLVLELQAPAAGGDLWRELAREWPTYLGYFVSFAFIGGSWIAHCTLTRSVRTADAVLLRLNLLLLLCVSLLPFTTSLMAQNLGVDGERPAAVLFGLNLTVSAAVTSLVVRYVLRRPHLGAEENGTTADLAVFARERHVATLSLVVATVLAVFLPVVAVAVFLLISVLVLLEPLLRTRRGTTTPRGAAPAGDGTE